MFHARQDYHYIQENHIQMKALFPGLLLLLISSAMYAQPFTLDDQIQPEELNLYPFAPASNPKLKGRLNVTEVTQVKDTLYFFAKGMSIYSPVYVGLTLQEKDRPVEVRLCKMNWKNANQSGTTDGKGHWEHRFKTENDFGIMVVAKSGPVHYSLMVWNGDEAKFDLPSVFSKEKNSGSGAGFFKKNLLYLVIGLLVVVVGILFFKLKKRNNEKPEA